MIQDFIILYFVQIEKKRLWRAREHIIFGKQRVLNQETTQPSLIYWPSIHAELEHKLETVTCLKNFVQPSVLPLPWVS